MVISKHYKRKFLSFAVLGGMIFFPYANIWAHSESHKTIPAHQSTVTPPKSISIEFSDKIKLTKVVLVKIGGDSYPIKAQRRLMRKFTAPLDKVLIAGDYKVEWRGFGIDGHATEGAFTFTVKP